MCAIHTYTDHYRGSLKCTKVLRDHLFEEGDRLIYKENRVVSQTSYVMDIFRIRPITFPSKNNLSGWDISKTETLIHHFRSAKYHMHDESISRAEAVVDPKKTTTKRSEVKEQVIKFSVVCGLIN